MSTEPPTLILIANSARAIAQSAARGGYRVLVLDAFADQDTLDCADCLRVPLRGAGLDPERVRSVLEQLLADENGTGQNLVGVVYGAGLEADPSTLDWIAERLPLLGNSAEVLTLVSDPGRIFPLLDALDIPYPESRLTPPPAKQDSTWLVKEPASSGGQAVWVWGDSARRPDSLHYFQRHLPGIPMSLLFIANGKEHRVIGYNRLLTSDIHGDRPFLYGGALGRALLDARVSQSVEDYATALTAALGLRGLSSLDFMLHEGRPYLLELNPRPSATMSLYEHDCAEGWINRHVRACSGELPEQPHSARPGVVGQSILYAWDDLLIPEDIVWPNWIHDRPVAGSRIPRGAPLCSLSAEGPHAAWVESTLAELSRRLRERLLSSARPATRTEEAR